SGGVAFENARVRNSAIVIDTVTGGSDGNDTITITSANNAHGNTSLLVSTGTGTDSLTVSGTATFAGTLTANVATVNLNADVTNPITGTASTVNVAAPGQIQDGIAVATSGATVNVAAGTYPETVNLNISATVRLQGGVTTNAFASINGSTIDLNGNTLTTGDATSTTIAGVITGTGASAFTKQGAGL